MKPTLPTFLLAATLCASALVTPTARADYMDFGQVYITAGMNMAAMQPTMDMVRRQADENRSASQNTGSKSSPGVRKTPQKKALTTTYRESSAVHKRVLTRFTDWLDTKLNATDAASLRRAFEQDALSEWAKGNASDGLKRGDVADAMTDYWVKNWMIANRVTFTSRAQVQAVRRFFASVLSSNPTFAKTTDAQRQEMAEGYIYNSQFQSIAFVSVFHTGDKALIQKLSDGRAASFKTETGFDLRTVKLTNAGFAPK